MSRWLCAVGEVRVAIEVTKLVWDVELPPTETCVLLALADFASPDGSDVYPGTARVVHMTGYSDRTIRKVRQRFVQRRILLLDRPSTPTSPAHYTINLEELQRLRGGSGEKQTPERASPPEPDSAPEPGSPPDCEGRGGVNQVPGGGEPRSSKPPKEPPIEPPPGGSDLRREDIEAEIEAAWEQTPDKTKIRSPKKYKDTIRQRLEGEHRAAAEQLRKTRQHQESIDACGRCNSAGIVLIETSGGPCGERCTHDPADYTGLEIATESDDARKLPV
jgi:hypothetical protein